ncbi:MAG: FeoA family protein [Candidatus Thiodiazotropha sp.]|jgi:ferrous iron transport protein A
MQINETNDKAPFPLAMAQKDEKVNICSLCGGKGLKTRLTSLGLNVGSEVTILQRRGGNLVVIRGETRLALGAGMAQKIMVTQQQ